jgi:hemolysin III
MLTCSALYNMIRCRTGRTVCGGSTSRRSISRSRAPTRPSSCFSRIARVLAGIWAVAIAGASLIVFSARRHTLVAIILYLGLGWAGYVLGQPLIEGLSGAGAALLVTAGLLYTGGIAFLLWNRLPFHNTIWHVFVLAATCVCYAAIAVEVMGAFPPLSV